MGKTIIRVLAPLLVIAGGVGVSVLLHATKPQPEKSGDKARPVSVYTAPVQRQDVVLEVFTQGEVRPRTELDLVAQVSGRIVAVSPEFTEGGIITPGEALLEIEDTDYRLALREAQARVAEARVAVEQALADADVARKQLRNEPNASDLALKKPQVARARAQLEAAEAGLEQARLDLERTRITLPFEGRLTATRADKGQYITAGAVVGHAFASDVVEVRLPLADAQLASLGLPIGYSAEAGGGLPVDFSARVAGTQQHWRGRLTRLDAAIDPATRTLYGMAELHSPYRDNVSDLGMPMAVGLYVEATIQGRSMRDARLIPAEALRAGDTVYLVSEAGTLDIRQVDVLHRNGERAVISAGLEGGERVVTSAIRNPIQGMAIYSIDGDDTAVATN
ncbi:efflux RND transporter periplasmic adaptor subunit [Parahaliea mediterranea]|uniref:Efflux RND transporter periplasmic adaptor subunit n=1 Tax=Parahaliea mediterranea TaxID=651086 RepID=A0A939DHC1_9GAMM|nr:efflux RND transporter periplasmic adaptor subunit [Parahaliea mediterranea]MBN7797487.1 efflux RND transporter periplasmic adaptor subunit [Parahaliea mediterranea]